MRLTTNGMLIRHWAALTLGVLALGLPMDAYAEKALPPPPAPPPAPANAQPMPPPNGQPPPGYSPYPYPYAQPGQTGYPPPYGYPPGAGAYGSGPEVMPYDEEQPIPPGYVPQERIRKGLVIPGAIIFGTVYFFTAVGGGLNIDSSRAPYGALLVPVAGPFIVAGTGNFVLGDLTAMMFVFDGLLQAGGAAMLLSGIFAKKKVLVRQDMAQTVRPEVLVGPGSIGMKLTF